MPYQLSRATTFKFKVEIRRPNDAGGLDAFDFVGEFKRLDQSKIRELMGKQRSDREMCDEIFVGWSGIADADGKPLEVNDVNRTALLLEPGAEGAIIKAWLKGAVTGPLGN
jgi:hypothetical protein